jgi:hypothetical protein
MRNLMKRSNENMCSLLYHARYVLCLVIFLDCDIKHNIWKGNQILKPVITQFSPTSYFFIPLMSKYYSQHPLLRHP